MTTVIHAGTAPRFELPGVRFVGGAAPSRGSAGLCVWTVTVDAGLVSPEPHSLDQDEIFRVTKGAIKLALDGEVVAAGDVAIVPAGSSIQLVNPGTEPAEAVVVVRSGFVAKTADGEVISTPPWAA